MPFISCSECLFWIAAGDGDKGVCHRRAPTPETHNDDDDNGLAPDLWAYWPKTFAEDGCGDGEAKPAT